MELRIAKYLKGHRVPMSGAGSIKGDCLVITDKCGQIYIECKYTAATHVDTGEPIIRLDFKWLDKMQRDAEIMRSRFPALVFRYHDKRLSDYVIVGVDVFQRYADDPQCDRLDNLAVLEAEDKSGLNLQRRALLAAFTANPRGENICMLHCKKGWFVVMTIDLFRDMINEEESI